MPVSFEIDSESRVVTLTASGSPSAEDYWKTFESVRKDPRYRPTMSTIVDARGVTSLEYLPTASIRMIARREEEDPDQRRYGRVAIVVASDIAFGLARLYALERGNAPREVGVFR